VLSPIYLVGDESLFLQGGLFIYDFFGRSWHVFFQYVFWILILIAGFIIFAKKNIKSFDAALNNTARLFSEFVSGRSGRTILFAMIAIFLFMYFLLLRNIPYNLTFLRYPPMYKFIYLIPYLSIGINHIGPRIVQLTFYLLTALYLYRTISLFAEKDVGLLGASIYLFSPIIFAHAHFAELPSGFIFFIVLISYHMLRYFQYGDKRSLLLTPYLIGIGSLYKRDIFLMFFVCLAYLIFNKIRNRDYRLTLDVKILLLALIPVIPWLAIGRFFNWRNYVIVWSHFASLDSIASYFMMIPSQVSWPLFLLFLFSVVFILVSKKDHLSLFFGLVFVVFYLFYTADFSAKIHRFMMAFYPTIAVFMARFITAITNKLRWRYAFKAAFSVLTVYLIILCSVPSLSARFITYKDIKAQYFPVDKSMQWVRDNVKEGERILTLRFKPDLFYIDRYEIDRDRVVSIWYDLSRFSTVKEFREFLRTNIIKYIMFPYGPDFIVGEDNRKILGYLRLNPDNEFKEVAKFSMDKNHIYIYSF
jgi:hypothetical protein